MLCNAVLDPDPLSFSLSSLTVMLGRFWKISICALAYLFCVSANSSKPVVVSWKPTNNYFVTSEEGVMYTLNIKFFSSPKLSNILNAVRDWTAKRSSISCRNKAISWDLAPIFLVMIRLVGVILRKQSSSTFQVAVFATVPFLHMILVPIGKFRPSVVKIALSLSRDKKIIFKKVWYELENI